MSIAKLIADVEREHEILVRPFRMVSETDAPIRIEVGLEDRLYIEFGYNKCVSVSLFIYTDCYLPNFYFTDLA